MSYKKSHSHLCKTPKVAYPFICKCRSMFWVEKICQVLEASMSGYHTWLKHPKSKHKQLNEELLERIKIAFNQSRLTYVSPRINYALKNQGTSCSKNRVASLSIFDYIEVFYNHIRLHSKLRYKSPADFEKSFVVT